MSESPGERPTFVRPKWFEPEDVSQARRGVDPTAPPPTPTLQQARNLRLAVVASVLTTTVAVLAWVVFGIQEMFGALLLEVIMIRYVVRLTRTNAELRGTLWQIRYAFLGNRAGPAPRPMSPEQEARHRQLMAELEAIAATAPPWDPAREAASERSQAVRHWIESGLVPKAAPSRELVVDPEAVPLHAELTESEILAVSHTADSRAWPDRSPRADDETVYDHRRRLRAADGFETLAERGIVRQIGPVYELSPEMMPLVGVGVFVQSRAHVSDGRHLSALQVAGHHVVAEDHALGGSTSTSDEQYTFRRTSLDAVVDDVLATLVSAPPTPREHPGDPVVHVFLRRDDMAATKLWREAPGQYRVQGADGSVTGGLTTEQLRRRIRGLLDVD